MHTCSILAPTVVAGTVGAATALEDLREICFLIASINSG